MDRHSLQSRIRCASRGWLSVLALILVWTSVGSTPQSRVAAQTRQLQLSEPVSSWPGKAKRWALVIGVDQYRDGNISPLRGAANDAAALARALTEFAGFPADQVILLATNQPEERQPTRINILSYFSNLAAVVPKDGLLLVSFAGHGIERGGQAYLIPSDAKLTDGVSLLEESAVSVERLHQRIRATGAAQVVILLDACRNDPGGRAEAANPLTLAYTRSFNFDVRNHEVQAFATLYATGIGERAYEYQEKKQGYFTWAVVEGLKGAAANDRGEVTLGGLVRYVQELVPRRIAIDLGAGKKQYPFANIEGYRADDLIIAAGGSSVADTHQTSVSGSRTDPAALEQEAWEAIRNSANAEDFRDYLLTYPGGAHAMIARSNLRRLEPAKSGAIASPGNADANKGAGSVASGTKDNRTPSSSQPVATKPPIHRTGLVKALEINGLTTAELVQEIEKRGVDFELTPDVERELRAAGARPAVIEAVRHNYRSLNAQP